MNEPPFLRHAWLLFIAVTVANALVLKFRSRAYIRRRPELAAGYRQFFRGVLLWGNLPWVVMGAGILLGGVPSVFSYFRPRDGNPFVLAWFGVVVALWLLGFHWLFARRGAEFLVEHPGLLRGDPKSPAMIRLFYCLVVAGGVAGFCFMFFANIPEFTVAQPPLPAQAALRSAVAEPGRLGSSRMNYTTVFDVTQAGFRAWPFAGAGLACLIISVAALVLVKNGLLKEAAVGVGKWYPRALFGFAFLWGALALFGPLCEYWRAVDTMRNNKATMVEGVVSEFTPMPPEGHRDESFVVQGIKFQFSDYSITAGFNNTSSHGGPLREGLPVRIWYSGRDILRLDIGK